MLTYIINLKSMKNLIATKELFIAKPQSLMSMNINETTVEHHNPVPFSPRHDLSHVSWFQMSDTTAKVP